MSDFEFCIYRDELPSDWDSFVIPHEYGSVHQTQDWKYFQLQIPGREQVFGFAVRDRVSGNFLATTLCVQMKTGIGNSFWWYSARGPVFDPFVQKDAGVFLLHNVQEHLSNTGGIFWRIDPYFSRADFDRLEIPWEITTQDYQPTDTLEIDLTKSNDVLQQEMKRKGRYNISLAQKKEIALISRANGDFTETDLDDFWRLNTETTSRDGFSGHSKEYYRSFLTSLAPYAVLFFAETADGVRIATAISTFCGAKAIYYFGASTSTAEYRALMAPYLLQWEMIQYAKQKQCRTYDFLGIAPEGQDNHPYAGISEFKWKFGGSRKTYDQGKELILRPWLYRLYRWAKKRK